MDVYESTIIHIKMANEYFNFEHKNQLVYFMGYLKYSVRSTM